MPSPGTVYPTLTMLEDLGYARAVPEEGGKKVYEITDEGRKYLAEHSTTVDDIFERIARFVEGFTDTPMMELNQAFQRLARTTYKTATGHLGEKEMLERLRDIIRRAADEIEAATKQTPETPPPADIRGRWANRFAARGFGDALDFDDGSRISSATHFCVVSDGSSPVRQRSDALVAEAAFMTSHPRPAGSAASDPPPARSASGSHQASPLAHRPPDDDAASASRERAADDRHDDWLSRRCGSAATPRRGTSRAASDSGSSR